MKRRDKQHHPVLLLSQRPHQRTGHLHPRVSPKRVERKVVKSRRGHQAFRRISQILIQMTNIRILR